MSFFRTHGFDLDLDLDLDPSDYGDDDCEPRCRRCGNTGYLAWEPCCGIREEIEEWRQAKLDAAKAEEAAEEAAYLAEEAARAAEEAEELEDAA